MLMKRASGVAAKAVGPRGFLWTVLVAVGFLILASAVFWWPPAMTAWMAANGVAMVVTAFAGLMRCEDSDFEPGNLDAPLTLWIAMGEIAGTRGRASFARLILWTLLTPVELAVTCVAWPLTRLVRALLRPMPGKW